MGLGERMSENELYLSRGLKLGVWIEGDELYFVAGTWNWERRSLGTNFPLSLGFVIKSVDSWGWIIFCRWGLELRAWMVGDEISFVAGVWNWERNWFWMNYILSMGFEFGCVDRRGWIIICHRRLEYGACLWMSVI